MNVPLLTRASDAEFAHFGRAVLEIMENSADWNSETMEEIVLASEACGLVVHVESGKGSQNL